MPNKSHLLVENGKQYDLGKVFNVFDMDFSMDFSMPK